MNIFCSSLRPLSFLSLFLLSLMLVPGTVQSSECGVKKSTGQNRIINGQDAEANEWPWMGSLRERRGRQIRPFCGASVIGSRWIITAAHCLRGKDPKTLEVALGLHRKFQRWGDNYEVYKVEEVINHEELDKTGQFENDIAVIKVTKDIDLGLHTPICLPGRNEDFAGSKAMATGWGIVSFSGRWGQRPQDANVLQEVSLTIGTDCGGVPSGTICAVGSEANICGGDSGGPLMVEKNGRQTLAGITSWVTHKQNGQCDENQPAYFADVSYFRGWIKEKTGI